MNDRVSFAVGLDNIQITQREAGIVACALSSLANSAVSARSPVFASEVDSLLTRFLEVASSPSIS